jgi:hypothetical protein
MRHCLALRFLHTEHILKVVLDSESYSDVFRALLADQIEAYSIICKTECLLYFAL